MTSEFQELISIDYFYGLKIYIVDYDEKERKTIWGGYLRHGTPVGGTIHIDVDQDCESPEEVISTLLRMYENV